MSTKSLRSSLGISPKTSFYFSNGSGRDMYIMHDNGGTVKGRPSSGFPQPGRFFKNSEGPRIYKPYSDNKVVHYISDGTGRDNYILINSGGLMSKTYTVNERFKNMLRDNENNKPAQAADNIEKMRLYNPALNQRQRVQSAKMSRPKQVNVPFNHFVQTAVAKNKAATQTSSTSRLTTTPSVPQLPHPTYNNYEQFYRQY